MRAVVDQDLCIGCGLCTGMCERAFRMNAEGKAECCEDGDEQEMQVDDRILPEIRHCKAAKLSADGFAAFFFADKRKRICYTS